jgi:predicted AlkP superfamily pyrophosphatase or phosphodiesterase
MKRIALFVLLAASLIGAQPPKPKLILAIVIDQFRYDYLTRFRGEYHAGLDRLLTKGAVFTAARYEHFPTITAVGHSTFLSGALPSTSGIIANDWYDREERRKVTSVSDSRTKLLGGKPDAEGSSPHRLLVDTVGDELKMANNGQSHVVGISLKDRASILPVGRMADGAYWFDTNTGNFVSSTWYFPDLPAWVKEFNLSRPGDRFANTMWHTKKLPAPGPALYTAIEASPWGNEVIEAFAESALGNEQLGKHAGTDILAVSFSSNDYVGHTMGPDSAEVHEMCVRTDALLEKLFQAAGRAAGPENVLVVLTADHGVAPMPELNNQRKMPGGRIPVGTFSKAIQAGLVQKYGEGAWVLSDSEHSIYLNLDPIAQKNLNRAEVNRAAAECVFALPHVFRVYTREQLMQGLTQDDPVAHRVKVSFNARRGPDVEILLEPYWIFPATGTSHGTAFSYDNHVPLIFMGRGIKPGRYNHAAAVNDVAPTLSEILEVETPAGSIGRVLSEMFEP